MAERHAGLVAGRKSDGEPSPRRGLLTEARWTETLVIALAQPRFRLFGQRHRVAPASARAALEPLTARGARLFTDSVVSRFVHDGSLFWRKPPVATCRPIKRRFTANACDATRDRLILYTSRLAAIFRIGYRVRVADVERTNDEPFPAGLCADCLYARRVESARRSAFYLCQRSATDSTFPRYPRLPVIRCSGHAPRQLERTPQG